MSAGIATSATGLGQPEARQGSRVGEGLAARLNWLRAGVLGANDGIVSVAAVIVGVAAATTSRTAIIIAGAAALVGGALSMALGEYVSVSSARDSQRSAIATARRAANGGSGRDLLVEHFVRRGLSDETARRAAEEISAHEHHGVRDAAYLEAAGIDEDDVVSPWHAALASALSFVLGALLPFVTVLLVAPSARVVATIGAVLVALALLGAAGAKLGGASVARPTLRVVVGGALALAVTFVIGSLLGVGIA